MIVRSLGREDGRGTTWMKREIDVLSISLSAHVLRTRMGGKEGEKGRRKNEEEPAAPPCFEDALGAHLSRAV